MLLRTLAPIFFLFFLTQACSQVPHRPCTEAGQAPHEPPIPGIGLRQCEQEKDKKGVYLNQGKYREWYFNDKIACTGEYQAGKKSGKWTHFDNYGQKTSIRYYQEGVEIPESEYEKLLYSKK